MTLIIVEQPAPCYVCGATTTEAVLYRHGAHALHHRHVEELPLARRVELLEAKLAKEKEAA